MVIEEVTHDGRLWSVKYAGSERNALESLFEQWSDPSWLRVFFENNSTDLSAYFKITDINHAIYDTICDNERLQCLILDISPDADLDQSSLQPLCKKELIP